MKSAHWIGSIATPSSSPAPLARFCDMALEWLDRSRERRALARLDDRLLADIGMSRSDAWIEHSKRFWEK